MIALSLLAIVATADPLPAGAVLQFDRRSFRIDEPASSAVCSHDGKSIYVATATHILALDAETGRIRQRVPHEARAGQSIPYLLRERSTYRLFNSNLGVVFDIDPMTGETLRRGVSVKSRQRFAFGGDPDNEMTALVSPCGRWILNLHQHHDDNGERQPHLRTLSILPAFENSPAARIGTFQFTSFGPRIEISPRDTYVAVPLVDGSIHVHELTSRVLIHERKAAARQRLGGFTADERLLIWTFEQNEWRLEAIDLGTGRSTLLAVFGNLATPAGPEPPARLAFSADMNRMAVLGIVRKTRQFVDLTTGKTFGPAVETDPVDGEILFCNDGRTLLERTTSRRLAVIDVATNRPVAGSGDSPADYEHLALTRDRMLVVLCRERLWIADAATGRWGVPRNLPLPDWARQNQIPGRVPSPPVPLALSHDGEQLLLPDEANGMYRIWHWRTGRSVPLKHHPVQAGLLSCFSSDDRHIAFLTSRYSGRWASFNGTGGIRSLEHNSYLIAVDGERIALGGDPRTDAAGRPEIRIIGSIPRQNRVLTMPFPAMVTDLTWSNDGKQLAVAAFRTETEGSMVCWFDVETGKLLRTDSLSAARLYRIAMSPDGTTLAGLTSGFRVAFIEVASGQTRLAYEGHADEYDPKKNGDWELRILKSTGLKRTGIQNGLAWSPESDRLVTTCPGGSARMWTTRPEPVPGKSLAACWDDLAGDAPTALKAMTRLRQEPDRTLAFLREKLPAAAAPERSNYLRLFESLDAADFQERERTTFDLIRIREFLRDELTDLGRLTPSAEVRRRVATILSAGHTMTPGDLRPVRAVELVSWIGSDKARQLLRDWSEGDPRVPQTQAAQRLLKAKSAPVP